MRRQLLLASAASLLLAVPALAQPGTATQSPARSGTTAGTASGSTTTSAQRMTATEFARMAMMGDRFEMASSRLAQSQAQNDQVKQFAADMVRDHTRTTQELTELTQRAGVQMSGMMPHGGQMGGQASGSAARSGSPGGAPTGGSGTSSTQGAGQGA
ncbi:MAG: DUF4142 domain-containing protein, partial [Acetobacteraceae bacterium]|nr:DUF4142 domain-containing protein [Acetobacteraceae bacterium]